ncbi:ABC transporter permease [Chelativorans sp. Marseille-P2723]|uniref:ABC transporter permease n=1 Tax=Chelativorans sp. Marseille-P2723 TaxID=2709133 RepID=UPI00156FD972|nr:ABC transporter permease [Chelativorans sp. Marseille-P2723]
MHLDSIGFPAIAAAMIARFLPVWIALAAILLPSFKFRKRLGLYGQLLETGVGVAGLAICLFWLFTAVFADIIAPFDPLRQIVIMKNAAPGTIEPESGLPFILGGDRLARDVFSRVVFGSQIVLVIAPAATLFSLMVGTMLGLPAGYYGGRVDGVLSFLANLVLAFPVILLFYLLVTPGIRETAIPQWLGGVFLVFPIAFFVMLFWTRYASRPGLLAVQLGATLLIGGWIYAGLVFDADPLRIISIAPNELNIFVAVVFASSPGVFRIVRGLTMDIRTRDYIAAAQTRGESPWYIMLWEVLPNARGPLIVDACLRIGYTAILLGALGYFGLGLAPESPDWGTAIKESSRLLRADVHPALPPVMALMSFVLGLNLVADALREQSMKD